MVAPCRLALARIGQRAIAAVPQATQKLSVPILTPQEPLSSPQFFRLIPFGINFFGVKIFYPFFLKQIFSRSTFLANFFGHKVFFDQIFASNAFWFLAKFFVSFCKLNFYDQISSGSTFFYSIFRGQFSSLANFFRDYSILVEKHWKAQICQQNCPKNIWTPEYWTKKIGRE